MCVFFPLFHVWCLTAMCWLDFGYRQCTGLAPAPGGGGGGGSAVTTICTFNECQYPAGWATGYFKKKWRADPSDLFPELSWMKNPATEPHLYGHSNIDIPPLPFSPFSPPFPRGFRATLTHFVPPSRAPADLPYRFAPCASDAENGDRVGPPLTRIHP